VATGPNVPACSYNESSSNYRGCILSILHSYNQQKVAGVRIYFGVGGEVFSTPFLAGGTLNPIWQNNFSLLMQDIRAANIKYVSLVLAWDTYTTGGFSIYACITGPSGPDLHYTYNFTNFSDCNGANAVFYPWLPWALTVTPDGHGGYTQGGPYDASRQKAYEVAPALGDPNAPPGSPQPWPWSSTSGPLFNFFDFIFGEAHNAQLSVREFNIMPEVPMVVSSIFGRLAYDPIQRAAPMGVINTIMDNHQLIGAAALSTAAGWPQYNQFCDSPLMRSITNSGLVVNEYLLVSANTSGAFGRLIGFDPCQAIDPSDMISGKPPGGIPVINVHNYPVDAVFDNGAGWIPDSNFSGPQYYPDGAPITNSPFGCNGASCTQNTSNDTDPNNSSGDSTTAATMIYSAISQFASTYYGLPVIIGETDSYNPGGTGREGIYFPAITEGSDCRTYGPYDNLVNSYRDPGTGVVHAVNFACWPDWKWHRDWSTTSASENVAGFKASGLNRSSTVLSPWAPVGWGSILSPAPLSGSANSPYNVGSCSYYPQYSFVIPAEAISMGITGGNQPGSNCWWSYGPTPAPGGAAFPSWFSPTSPVWQSGAEGVNVNLSPNTTGSARSFQLTVTGQSITATQNYVLTPTIVSPAYGATGVSLTPTLTWNQSTGATAYVLSLGTSMSGLTYLATVNGASSTSYTLSTLQANTTYYASIQATNSLGGSFWAYWSFTTMQSLAAPGSLNPPNGSINVARSPVLTWSPSSGASSYTICYGVTNPPPTTNCPTLTGQNNTAFDSPALANGTIYYWQVTATNASGSASSAVASFTTIAYGSQRTPGASVGVFRSGMAFLEDSNGDGAYEAYVDRYIPNFTAPGGHAPGDLAVTGDWTGDGHFRAGIFRPSTGQWFLDINNDGVYDAGDVTYSFGGLAGDVPVVGDWTGVGKSCIGVFRSGFWVLDLNCNGAWDSSTEGGFWFGGIPNDKPVVGKWHGGNTRVGVVRCYYYDNICQGYPYYWIYDAGDPNCTPASTCHQVDYTTGLYAFGGLDGDQYVAGDWFNTGTSRPGIYRPSSGLWLLMDAWDQGYISFGYGGVSGDVGIVGKW
jgi:hypothetical protein